LNAWQRQAKRVDLASSGGHRVAFSDLRVYPLSFPMRHYLFLSIDHAIQKWVHRRYDPAEVEVGWHRARATLRAENIKLPSQRNMRYYTSDDQLDASNPLEMHPMFVDVLDELNNRGE
jgi:hypothetical protein